MSRRRRKIGVLDSPGIKPHLVQGAKNVKYAAAFWGVIAFVREDGTAAWLWANEEDDIQELEGWSDIAMVYVNGDLDDYWNVIGLSKQGIIRSDGTAFSKRHYIAPDSKSFYVKIGIRTVIQGVNNASICM